MISLSLSSSICSICIRFLNFDTMGMLYQIILCCGRLSCALHDFQQHTWLLSTLDSSTPTHKSWQPESLWAKLNAFEGMKLPPAENLWSMPTAIFLQESFPIPTFPISVRFQFHRLISLEYLSSLLELQLVVNLTSVNTSKMPLSFPSSIATIYIIYWTCALYFPKYLFFNYLMWMS